MIPIEHTVAEDLLLLLLDERSGDPVISLVALDRALGGALLVELAVWGRVGPAAPGAIHVEDRTSTGDDLLDAALDHLEDEPATTRRHVERLAAIARKQTEERLIRRGWISCTRSRKWGLFPVETWHVLAPERKHALCGRPTEVLLNGRAPDAREAALLVLLHAVDAVPEVVPGDPAQLNARAQSLIEAAGLDADQTAQAVQEAVRAVLAVIITSVLVATTTATVTTTTC